MEIISISVWKIEATYATSTLCAALLHHGELTVVFVGQLLRPAHGLGHGGLARSKGNRRQTEHIHPRFHIALVFSSKDVLTSTILLPVESLVHEQQHGRRCRTLNANGRLPGFSDLSQSVMVKLGSGIIPKADMSCNVRACEMKWDRDVLTGITLGDLK